MPGTQRRIVLRERPSGPVAPGAFTLETAAIPESDADSLILQNQYLSIDPAIRQWIAGRGGYLAPIAPGDTVRSVVIGRVVHSGLPGYAPGDCVRALGGWEEYSRIEIRDFPVKIEEAPGLPLTAHFSVLGNSGLAAWFGLFEVACIAPGEVVAVSSAAGAVGAIVGQLGRAHGCRMIAIAGGAEKCARCIARYGYDAAIDYRSEDVRAALKRHAPRGISVFFDNVGGDILEAGIARIARRGRVIICGATAHYDTGEPMRGPANYLTLLERGARMEGFQAGLFVERFGEAVADLAMRLGEGSLVYDEDIRGGLEQAPQMLTDLLAGGIIGKPVVKL